MADDQRSPVPRPSVPARGPARLRLVYWLIAGAAVLVGSGLAVGLVRRAINASGHELTRNHILNVSLALRDYSESYGHLPYPVVRQQPAGQAPETGPPHRAGRPLYSWRVEIVGFLESWHGTWDPSQAWDSPSNQQLVELSSFYAYDASGRRGQPQAFPATNLLALTGPGTAFGDGTGPPRALKDIPPQTILVVETRASGIPWPAPGDFDIRTMPHTINAPDGKGISSRYAGGFHVIFADGWMWMLSDKVPFETLQKFFTTADAAKHDREQLLGRFALHRGP